MRGRPQLFTRRDIESDDVLSITAQSHSNDAPARDGQRRVAAPCARRLPCERRAFGEIPSRLGPRHCGQSPAVCETAPPAKHNSITTAPNTALTLNLFIAPISFTAL